MRLIFQICGAYQNKSIICCPINTLTTTTQKPTWRNNEENDERNCAYPPIAIKVRRDEWPHKSWNSKEIIIIINNNFLNLP